jgi:hypothetical protein
MKVEPADAALRLGRFDAEPSNDMRKKITPRWNGRPLNLHCHACAWSRGNFRSAFNLGSRRTARAPRETFSCSAGSSSGGDVRFDIKIIFVLVDVGLRSQSLADPTLS